MKHIVTFIAVLFLLSSLALSCKGKRKEKDNKVPMEQVDIDGSNDYRYIFRDSIKSGKSRDGKSKKSDFAE